MPKLQQLATVNSPSPNLEPPEFAPVPLNVGITGNAGSARSIGSVSARALLVRGNGILSKPKTSNVGIIKSLQTETVILSDDRIRVLDPEELPWRMVCSLEIRGERGGGIGTGWFVSPRTIITAGHCVFHPTLGGSKWAQEIKIYPGRSGMNFPYPADPQVPKPLTSNVFQTTDGWIQNLDPDCDFAAIHIDRPLGEETGYFSVAVLDDDSLRSNLVNVSGYPGDRDFGRYQYFASSKVDTVLDHRFFYEADTFAGQSGGPVWIQDLSDNPVVVGIHTYGEGGSFVLNSATRINADVLEVMQSWIAGVNL